MTEKMNVLYTNDRHACVMKLLWIEMNTSRRCNVSIYSRAIFPIIAEIEPFIWCRNVREPCCLCRNVKGRETLREFVFDIRDCLRRGYMDSKRWLYNLFLQVMAV